MKLPNNEIGISDILQWRACPQRFELGMRRHTGNQAPESESAASAYGSAIHEAIRVLERTQDEDAAIAAAVKEYAGWLDPDDLVMLRGDLEIYKERDPLGVRTVVSEEDLRFPLMEYLGETIYFRFKLDRLYVRHDDDTRFISVDYKSSKWVKSQEEVHSDIQQWAYNVGIHELYPECEDLEQRYDQLKFGVLSTHKTAEQRERMKEWLCAMVVAILEDHELAPKFNDFCAYCPLKMDCKVVREELTDYAQSKIAVLAPRHPKPKKDGSPSKVLLPPELDPERFDEYVEVLPTVADARKVLEAYEQEVKETLKEMPSERREDYGYEIREKSPRYIPAAGMRVLHESLGDLFFSLVNISLSGAERLLGKNDPRYELIEGETIKGAPSQEIWRKRGEA